MTDKLRQARGVTFAGAKVHIISAEQAAHDPRILQQEQSHERMLQEMRQAQERASAEKAAQQRADDARHYQQQIEQYARNQRQQNGHGNGGGSGNGYGDSSRQSAFMNAGGRQAPDYVAYEPDNPNGPSFVPYNGPTNTDKELFEIPKGAIGPFPTRNNDGFMYIIPETQQAVRFMKETSHHPARAVWMKMTIIHNRSRETDRVGNLVYQHAEYGTKNTVSRNDPRAHLYPKGLKRK